MSYNVTLADRSGEFCTAQISPDRKTLISEAGFATNHQGILEWTENSDLNKTRERAIFLKSILKRGYTIEKLTKAFLKPPLYNNHFIEGLGTLYTAVYRPIAGMVELHWPHHQKMIQSFDNFYEETKIITFKQSQISEV
jgi:predicted choloylglycine hydrolase